MRDWLEGAGIPVPAVFEHARDLDLLLIEDLGDTRLFDEVRVTPTKRTQAYSEAINLLVRLQSASRIHSPPNGIPMLSEALIRAEFDEFAAMGLEHRLGITLTRGERSVLRETCDTLCVELRPETIAHRDFQSQNLMTTSRGLVLIDFQDAFMAPRVYDLVALLRDSYVVLSQEELDALVHQYVAATGLDACLVEDRFHMQTIQRKLKDAGRFHSLALRGKPDFLQYFPASIAYVVHALKTSGRFPALLDLLSERLPEARGAL
jgi:hypothetical protein